MEEGKTVNDIVIENDIAVLYNVRFVEDIKLLWEFAIENNYEKFVAIKTNEDGTLTRYAFDGEKPVILNDGEYGINLEYKVPAETTENEEVLDDEENLALEENADLNTETEIVNENHDEVITENEPENKRDEDGAPNKIERSKEEIAMITEKAQLVDEYSSIIEKLKLENAELLEKNQSLQTEISNLNNELDTLRLNHEPVLTEIELTIDDVVEYLRKHEITYLGV